MVVGAPLDVPESYCLTDGRFLALIRAVDGDDQLLFINQLPSDFRYILPLREGAGLSIADGYSQSHGHAYTSGCMQIDQNRPPSRLVKGQPKDTNLDSYRVLRMGDAPEIEVEFLPSTATPVGLGEPATTPVAPAIANAIFAATGARVPHLPIWPQAVLEALARGS